MDHFFNRITGVSFFTTKNDSHKRAQTRMLFSSWRDFWTWSNHGGWFYLDKFFCIGISWKFWSIEALLIHWKYSLDLYGFLDESINLIKEKFALHSGTGRVEPCRTFSYPLCGSCSICCSIQVVIFSLNSLFLNDLPIIVLKDILCLVFLQCAIIMYRHA